MEDLKTVLLEMMKTQQEQQKLFESEFLERQKVQQE